MATGELLQGAVIEGGIVYELTLTQFLSDLEHEMFCGSTMGLDREANDINTYSGRRARLTIVSMDPKNSRANSLEAESDPAVVISERNNHFLQGLIFCFDKITLLAKQGLSIRILLPPLDDPKNGVTTDEWRVQVVRIKDGDRTIPLEKQEIVTGEELDNLQLRPGGKADRVMVFEPRQGNENFRWLHLKDIV